MKGAAIFFGSAFLIRFLRASNSSEIKENEMRNSLVLGRFS